MAQRPFSLNTPLDPRQLCFFFSVGRLTASKRGLGFATGVKLKMVVLFRFMFELELLFGWCRG